MKQDLKRWMKLMIFFSIATGIVAIYGGLGLILIRCRDFIQADPARMEGAMASAYFVGVILALLVVSVGWGKTLWRYIGIYNFAPVRILKRRLHWGRSDRREVTA